MVDVLDEERQALDPGIAKILDSDVEGDDEANDKRLIFCAACSHLLAAQAAAIEVNGAHLHHCENPHGYAFNVRCFAQALGCSISGQPEAADSWFPGYTWRYANCGECTTHLGWLFEDSEHFFYGLVKERIQTEG